MPLPGKLKVIWKDLHKITDDLHLDPRCAQNYLPTSLQDDISDMNTMSCEQTFAWLSRFKKILCAMPKEHHCFYTASWSESLETSTFPSDICIVEGLSSLRQYLWRPFKAGSTANLFCSNDVCMIIWWRMHSFSGGIFLGNNLTVLATIFMILHRSKLLFRSFIIILWSALLILMWLWNYVLQHTHTTTRGIMLRTWVKFADFHCLSLNAEKKTQLIKFYKFPHPVTASAKIAFLGNKLSLSNSTSHLGRTLTSNLSDDDDISNISIAKPTIFFMFSCYDPFVNTHLFSSSCLSLYGAVLWRSSSPQLKCIFFGRSDLFPPEPHWHCPFCSQAPEHLQRGSITF